jgi:hypothetical protein
MDLDSPDIDNSNGGSSRAPNLAKRVPLSRGQLMGGLATKSATLHGEAARRLLVERNLERRASATLPVYTGGGSPALWNVTPSS